jgi:hypothetical protein
MPLANSLGLRRSTLVLAALLLAAACPRSAHAAAQDFTVTFGTLPSTQGWTYFTNGVVAPETPTWGLSAGVLSYNTMAYLTNTSGTGTMSFYRKTGLVSGAEPIIIEMRGRILQHEHDGSSLIGGGFCMGFGTGATGWDLGIMPTQLRTISNAVIATVDNTQFHDYRLEWSPGPSVAYYVDNVLVSTNAGSFAGTTNEVFFGDGTGAANAQAQITYFRFRQGSSVTPTASTSWGRIKSLYR